MAGAPEGNQNAVKAKRWQQAIDRALDRRCKSDGIAELDRLADKFLDAIEEMADKKGQFGPNPSIAGFTELADRLDGKAHQSIDATVDASVTVEIVRHADTNTE